MAKYSLLAMVVLITTTLNISLHTTQRLQQPNKSNMKVKIGNKVFNATLDGSPTANALVAMLPLSLDMVELNGNEKYAELPKALPTKKFNPGRIETGDILLYGSSTIVIFYKSFSTPYSYTRLGKIDDVSGLAAALGAGNIQVDLSETP